MDQDIIHNHFTKIGTQIIDHLSNMGILDLKVNEHSDENLDIHSKDGQALIKAITVSLYEGTVKDMNDHRAPDFTQMQDDKEQQRQKEWRDANYHNPVPGPGRRG